MKYKVEGVVVLSAPEFPLFIGCPELLRPSQTAAAAKVKALS